MTREELKVFLEGRTDEEFVDREILTRRPWIFDGDAEFKDWRNSVSIEIRIAPENILIVGSAGTGFSLSPLKPGREFRKLPQPSGISSDIDVALLDRVLFEDAWDMIVATDRARRLGGSDDDRLRTRTDVYWGLVSQRSVPPNTDPARRILGALSALGRSPPLRGYPIKCRVYRRMEDLRGYHISSLRQLRAELAYV